jgi:hypothetical protein
MGMVSPPNRATRIASGPPQGRDSQRRPTEQHCRARGPSQVGVPSQSEAIIG